MATQTIDLAKKHGLWATDVAAVLAGKDSAAEVAQHYGLALSVAEDLVGSRPKPKGK